MRFAAVTLAFLALPAAAAPARAPATTIVLCAPGYPGSTAEAQPAVDAFAAALAETASLPASALAAVYHETEKGGVERLRASGAAVALVSLPFFLEHEKGLRLRAVLQAVPKGRGAMEQWSLVAKKGRIQGPDALDKFTIASIAGYSPRFVRGAALGAYGVPRGAVVVQSSAVLSVMRRAVGGDAVALLLDGAQEASLGSLPFAAELEVVARSPAVPTAVVAVVDKRMAAARWKILAAALERLPGTERGAAALEGIRMTGFVPLDEKALEVARKAFAAAGR